MLKKPIKEILTSDVIDFFLSESKGIEALIKIQAKALGAPIVVLSAFVISHDLKAPGESASWLIGCQLIMPISLMRRAGNS
ncbi:hypothetical protein KKH56_07135 [bacterium]|nr:hypothetical protein [bacterium]